jgi:hypothetical protein
MQAQHLAKNILSLAAGKPLAPYKLGPKVMLLPMGAKGGCSLLPFGVVGPGMTSSIKGKDLFTQQFRKDMGVTSRASVPGDFVDSKSPSGALVGTPSAARRSMSRMSAIGSMNEAELQQIYGDLDA